MKTRAVRLAATLVLLLPAFLASFPAKAAVGATAPDTSAARSEDERRARAAAPADAEDLILEIRVGKQRIADAFPALIGRGTVFLPVTQLADVLEIPAQLNLEQSLAEGKIGAGGTPWRVDARKGIVELGGKRTALPRDSYFVGPDDIYLDSREFGKIWPVKFTIRLNLLRLAIETTEPLPIEERLAREEAHKRLEKSLYRYPDFPLRESPYQPLSVPLGDIAFSSTALDRRTQAPQVYSALLAGDVAYMTGQVFVNGADLHNQPDIRLLLSRADERGGVFGVAPLKQFQIGDISTPAFENITNGRLERGAQASAFPVDLPTNFDRTVIEGDALAGWEAELYRNDALIDFQIVPQNGRYRFANVPLLIGNNFMRVALYGPQGQRREDTKRLFVGPGVAGTGQAYWRLSLSDANRQLITNNESNPFLFAPETRPHAGPVGSAEYIYGISDDWSIGGSFVRSPSNNPALTQGQPPSPAQNFGTLSLRTTQFGTLFTEQATATGSGTAFQSAAQTQIGDYGLTLAYNYYQHFQSELVGFGADALRDRLQARIDGYIPTLPFTTDAIDFSITGLFDHRVDGRAQTQLLHSVFTHVERVYFSNTVALAQDTVTGVTTNQIQGFFNTSGVIDAVSLRGQLQYTPSNAFHPQGFTGTIDWRASPRMLYEGVIDQTLAGRRVTTFGLSATRDFDNFLLGGLARAGTDGSLAFGVSLAISFGRTPSGNFLTSSRPMAARGAVDARVFIDRNNNGVFDAGDEVLPKAGLAIDHRQDFRTVSSGDNIVRTGLEPYRRTNVSVAEETLADPYVKPVGGISFIPRPGHMERVDLPVVETAELDGTLELTDGAGTRPLPGIKITLVDAKGTAAQQTTSAYDGYFYFAKILPGHYSLAVDAGTRAASFNFAIPPPFDLAPGDLRSGLVIKAGRAEAPPPGPAPVPPAQR